MSNNFSVSKRLDGVGEYYFSQKLREIDELNRQGKNIINLGIGSPDLPPHPDVIKTLQEESAKPNTHAYQNYKGSPLLRKAFAEWYQKFYGVTLNPDAEILPLIGSKEGIMHVCMTYFEEGIGVLVPNPGYPTYSSAVRLSGATPIYYNLKKENNFYPDINELQAIIESNKSASSQKIKGLFINYPHMPTGANASSKSFQEIILFAKKNNILVVHDNPYSFILNDSPQSILKSDGAMDVCIELNSLSKSHNMAGWRVGVLCGAKDRIDEVLRFKSNMDSGMFLPLQLAAAKALSLDESWYASVNNIYEARRKKVYDLLDALGCEYSKEQSGLFVWAKAPTPETGNKKHDLGSGGLLSDKVLYENNVFITPGGIFGDAGNDFIRVSLCSKEEMIDEAVSRIR